MLPAPANPEAWLAYAYGPGWRVPDPTFVFDVASGTKHRFESWFGVFNRGRFFWEKHWQGKDLATGSPGGAGAVRRLLEIMPPGSDVLDLGCGDGHWAQQLQAAGHRVICADYSFEALRVARLNVDRDLTLWRINANDRTALLELGANLVDTGRPWYVLCSDVLHGLTLANRENVYLMLRLVLRGPARAVVTFDTHSTVQYVRSDPRTWHYSLRELRDELAEEGLEIEEVHRGVRRTEVGWRRCARVVIRRSAAPPAERRAWIQERDENVA
ncbi:MAG: methyltransferase domain-containing protein [Actinomycetota bacterium]|nr:methyltransferase domain-containing protein [Actinomycetota bacterium]